MLCLVYGIFLYDTQCILYMFCLVYGIVMYGTECLWNVYGHLIELMAI